jgi:hypothetical protein
MKFSEENIRDLAKAFDTIHEFGFEETSVLAQYPNGTYEQSVFISREDVENDEYGKHSPRIEQMGWESRHYGRLMRTFKVTLVPAGSDVDTAIGLQLTAT